MLANPPSRIRISPELETPHRMPRGIIPSKLAAKDDRGEKERSVRCEQGQGLDGYDVERFGG
jgi:hypothetical protein